ncbi:MAG: Crp/Fnr family transcriptional regulator [Caulobacterales bacterium]|nr:Crp/Fnr family transcriptional regulator [Caulobacterales bacterium]
MTDRDDEEEPIAEDRLAAHLDADARERLFAAGRTVVYKAGEAIFHRHDDGDFMLVIRSGRIKVSNITGAGRELILTFLGPGDALGEIALLDGRERTADATALEETTALVVHRRDVLELMRGDPEMALSFISALCAKLRVTSDMLESAHKDMAQRTASAVTRLIDQYGRESEDGVVIDLKIGQSELAQYAGLSRSNVNRVLKEWERKGVGRHEKGVLTVLDEEAIRDLAEALE